MGRALVAIFYVLLGPGWILSEFPDDELAPWLALASGLGGLAVARIHWRQTRAGGRWGVALGTLAGSLGGFGAWCMAALALAFASDSGAYAKELAQALYVVTVLLILLAPPLGGLAGSGLAAILGRRGKSPETTE